jgi:hypothetical protein
MHASGSTWRLDESLKSEHAGENPAGGVLTQTLPVAREIGILDALIIRTATDRIVAVTVYDSQESADAAWAQASGPMSDLYASKLYLVDRVTGPARDMPELTVERK